MDENVLKYVFILHSSFIFYFDGGVDIINFFFIFFSSFPNCSGNELFLMWSLVETTALGFYEILSSTMPGSACHREAINFAVLLLLLISGNRLIRVRSHRITPNYFAKLVLHLNNLFRYTSIIVSFGVYRISGNRLIRVKSDRITTDYMARILLQLDNLFWCTTIVIVIIRGLPDIR